MCTLFPTLLDLSIQYVLFQNLFHSHHEPVSSGQAYIPPNPDRVQFFVVKEPA